MPDRQERLSLDAVNGMDAGGFTAAFGEIYEHSPWVGRGQPSRARRSTP